MATRKDSIAPNYAEHPAIARMHWLEAGALDVEPEPRDWLIRDGEQRGVIPLGEVGFLGGAGGTSKTYTALWLAISIATGRPAFGTYEVAARGASVLLLGEESQEECNWRLYQLAKALKLSADERREVERRVLVAPLKGVASALVAAGAVGDTELAHALFDKLSAERRDDAPYRLIVLDSLVRFGASDTEISNAAGAAFVVAAEKYTLLADKPAVMIIHHSNQASRVQGMAMGTTGLRGITALSDNARFVMTLTGDENSNLVTMRVTKNNYGPKHPTQPELMLAVREQGVPGLASVEELAAATEKTKIDSSKEARDAAEDVQFAILAEVRKHPGRHCSKNKIYAAVGGTKQTVLAQINALATDGRIVINAAGCYEPGVTS